MEEEKLERSIRKSEIPGLTREEEEAQLEKVIGIAERNLEQAKADAKAMKQQAQEKSRQLDKKQEDSIRQQEAVLKEDQETNSSAEIAGMRQAALQNEKDAIAAILENLV